jgi:hypothetical protein
MGAAAGAASVPVEECRWARWIQLLDQDEPGLRESLGSYNDGGPWQEQRSRTTEQKR